MKIDIDIPETVLEVALCKAHVRIVELENSNRMMREQLARLVSATTHNPHPQEP